MIYQAPMITMPLGTSMYVLSQITIDEVTGLTSLRTFHHLEESYLEMVARQWAARNFAQHEGYFRQL